LSVCMSSQLSVRSNCPSRAPPATQMPLPPARFSGYVLVGEGRNAASRVETRAVEQRAVGVGHGPRAGERDQGPGTVETRRGQGGGGRRRRGGGRRRGRAARGRAQRGARGRGRLRLRRFGRFGAPPSAAVAAPI